MPAGCTFFCNNDECEHYLKVIDVKGQWPLGDIDDVINSKKVQQDEELSDVLNKRKEDGRTVACITYPDPEDIPIIGYRVQEWCQKCPALLERDILFTEEDTDESIEEKVKDTQECIFCNSKTKSFNEILEESILCPFCKQEMEQQRWFAQRNEFDKEEDFKRQEHKKKVTTNEG